MQRDNIYSRDTPFYAAIKERYALCTHEKGGKTTYHIVLDIAGSGIDYQVGDSVGILPKNDHALVSALIERLEADPKALVENRHGKILCFSEYLRDYANLSSIPKKLVTAAHQRQSHSDKKELLGTLLAEGNGSLYKEYFAKRELIDFLKEQEEVPFTPEELSASLQPLLPRFYSIASSPKSHPEEIHLTVALLQYECADMLRHGVCSRFLWHDMPLFEAKIPIYIQPHKGFTLPEDPTAPIVMVGPGTGVAPFRAFMQERVLTEGAGDNWLFFGERHRIYHSYYESYWEQLKQQNMLKIEYAFSRDQAEKVYVQHKLLENGQEIFAWLEKGGYFFVCGDAESMAKDVEKALLAIIQDHSSCGEAAAKAYLKEMRQTKRYCRDVY